MYNWKTYVWDQTQWNFGMHTSQRGKEAEIHPGKESNSAAITMGISQSKGLD